MAEGDGTVANNFKEQLLLKTISMTVDELKVCLVSSGWTPTPDGANLAYSDVSGSELSGTGYTAGGEVLGSPAVTQDDANNRAKFDGADVAWTGLNAGTPASAVLYDNTTATKWVCAYWALTTASNGGNYTLQWHATNGLILLT